MMPFQSQLLTANIILQEGYFLTVLSLKEEKKQTDNGMKDSDEPLMEEEEEEEKKIKSMPGVGLRPEETCVSCFKRTHLCSFELLCSEPLLVQLN